MFKIEIINSGYIMADGGAMFGAIPKRAWQRKYEADNENCCPLVMRCVLAASDTHKILIDAGIGDKHLDKTSYYRPYNLKNIIEEIKTLGYQPEEITDVILTHLHFDHCGYATIQNNKGEVVPSFPNARYWISRKQWMNCFSPNRLEANSIFQDNISPVYDAGLLELIDEDKEICNGVNIELFDGHTEGQLVVYLQTNENIVVFPGDLVPTTAHVALEWISAYDINALTSFREKERFLEKAADSNYQLVYCHDAFISKSKVKRLNNDFIAYDKKE